MSMTAIATIKTLEKLIDRLNKSTDDERPILCMTIDSILDKLDDWACNSETAKELHPCSRVATIFITEMKAPLYTIAGIYDSGHDFTQCIVWLQSGLRKMSRPDCFDLK